MTEVFSLAGRVALVTGAGNGIGRAAALHLAGMGATVGVNDLKREFVDRVVAEIEAAGGQAIGVTQNISTRDGIRAAVLGLAEQAGRLDILVNNAAWVRYQAVPDIAPETMDRMLDVGFKAVIWGIQAAAEAMGDEGGSIVNIASTAAVQGLQNGLVYCGIKAGVTGITRAAAAELGPRGIRVNAIAPSAIPTEGTQRNRNAERDANRIARTPLGRLGPVVVGAAVSGVLTLVALPFVLGYGRIPTDPSFLPRDYGTTLLVLVVVVLAASAVWATVATLRARRAQEARDSA